MKFVLLYNCPLKKCDKLWLYNGLKKYGDVKIVGTLTNKTYFRISRFIPKLRIGKILVLILIFIQSIRSIVVSNKDDIIITWASKQGCILNNICNKLHIKRKIVSFMWIAIPSKNKKMIYRSFNDDNFLPIINNELLKGQFISLFNLKKWNGLFLPDVFDDSQSFKKPVFQTDNRFVFSGGVNNRDWETLLRVAQKTPNIQYIIVSDKNKIKNTIPKNVTLRENLSAKDYYSLMEKSFITICPLKENRTSGLINILKSSQFGIPCISAEFEITKTYYSTSLMKILLYEKCNTEDLKQKVEYIFNLNKDGYLKIASNFQNNIREKFNPENNIKMLIKELKNRNWLT
ncbi:hypothetical protein IKG33_02905 [Candidatus Saccharibacteria bacterium]|nr:hypothetical protein [Candidatus Saccharibacteria bacterium]